MDPSLLLCWFLKTTIGDGIVPAQWVPKDPSLYSDSEKEKIGHGQESTMDPDRISRSGVMYNNIVNRTSGKHIWETIEILCEGTIEVKDNQRQILVSQYEGFMANPNENITEVFERFNKLINDLQLHNKYYKTKEVNLKFLLTLPDHLESKISAIREGRDSNKITLQTLYGIIKTYELEFYQKKNMQTNRGKLTNVSSALIANELKVKSDDVVEEEVEPHKVVAKEGNEEEEFYTLEELDDMENQCMAYIARKFSNIRFKKNKALKPRQYTCSSSNNTGSKAP